jgi:hypothetical protein
MVARVALDDDLAVAHPGADVRSGVAGDRQAAAGHAGPEARDAGQVALDADVLLPRAGDVEQLAERRAAVAVPELEALDLDAGEAGEPIGGQRLGEDGCRGRVAQGQGERQGTSSFRWK